MAIKGVIYRHQKTKELALHAAAARGRLAPANCLKSHSEIIVRLMVVTIGKTAGSFLRVIFCSSRGPVDLPICPARKNGAGLGDEEGSWLRWCERGGGLRGRVELTL